MIERVISGGQTGADQAGWRAAKRFGIPTAGWMPKGFTTEAGPRPEFVGLYGAKEHASPSYAVRRKANILMADATIIFATDPESPGSKQTAVEAYELGKPCVLPKVYGDRPESYRVSALVKLWLPRRWSPKSINVAGNRESKSPGIGAWVEEYMAELFRQLGHKELPR